MNYEIQGLLASIFTVSHHLKFVDVLHVALVNLKYQECDALMS